MAVLIRSLLLSVCLFSHVYANKKTPQDAVKWLEPERSVLIHLATPDLFFCKFAVTDNAPCSYISILVAS